MLIDPLENQRKNQRIPTICPRCNGPITNDFFPHEYLCAYCGWRYYEDINSKQLEELRRLDKEADEDVSIDVKNLRIGAKRNGLPK